MQDTRCILFHSTCPDMMIDLHRHTNHQCDRHINQTRSVLFFSSFLLLLTVLLRSISNGISIFSAHNSDLDKSHVYHQLIISVQYSVNESSNRQANNETNGVLSYQYRWILFDSLLVNGHVSSMIRI
jgi:hypothetical protein